MFLDVTYFDIHGPNRHSHLMLRVNQVIMASNRFRRKSIQYKTVSGLYILIYSHETMRHLLLTSLNITCETCKNGSHDFRNTVVRSYFEVTILQSDFGLSNDEILKLKIFTIKI